MSFIVLLAASLAFTSAAGKSRLLHPPPSPAGLQIQSSHQCVDISGASTQSGASIVQVPCCSGCTQSQEWALTNATAEGWVQLQSEKSGMCITVPSQTDGAPLTQAPCGPTTDHAQFWALVAGPNSLLYQFQNVPSGLCLTVPGESDETGVQLVQSACQQGATNQLLRPTALLVESAEEKGPRLPPIPLDRSLGDLERGGRLLDAQAAEEPQLDEADESLVAMAQRGERLVQGEDLGGQRVRLHPRLVVPRGRGGFAVAAPHRTAAGGVHQDLAHGQ